MGSVEADAGAGRDALSPYEAPEPADPDSDLLLRDFVKRSGLSAIPAGHGWRVTVPLPLDRAQAVYLGHSGTDPEGRHLIRMISVCGPANERDTRLLLKVNSHVVEGHFAIKVLRGEEYFVVTHIVPTATLESLDAAALIWRIAESADKLEDRLSRGRDLY